MGMGESGRVAGMWGRESCSSVLHVPRWVKRVALGGRCLALPFPLPRRAVGLAARNAAGLVKLPIVEGRVYSEMMRES